MSRFKTLFEETGQSPWLNGLTRTCLRSGQLAQLVEAGIRGVLTLEATLLDGIARVSDPGAEGPRLSSLAAVGLGPEEICLELAIEDVSGALAVLRPVWERYRGADGFVSVELPPALDGDTEGIVDSAGDVANAWHPLLGRRLRLENWSSALNRGPAAARNAGIQKAIGEFIGQMTCSQARYDRFRQPPQIFHQSNAERDRKGP